MPGKMRNRKSRLLEQTWHKRDPDPKALACYGVHGPQGLPSDPVRRLMSLRFVTGRPVSGLTIQFLEWCCTQLQAQGKTAWLLIWDNASWHVSKQVRTWIREHNQQIRQTGKGVRILPFFLPTKSPWLNPIEPKWVHGKRAVVEPNGLLSAKQLAARVCELPLNSWTGETFEVYSFRKRVNKREESAKDLHRRV
jgi:transposase